MESKGKVDSSVTLNILYNSISAFLSNFSLESPKQNFSYIQTGLFTHLLEIHIFNFSLLLRLKLSLPRSWH